MSSAARIIQPEPHIERASLADVIELSNGRRPSGGRSRGRAGGIEAAGGSDPQSIIRSVSIVEWWRADSGVSQVANAVSQWTGKVNGTQLIQATGANQPTFAATNAAFNGQPTISGDGTNDELVASLAIPAPSTTPRFYWFVFSLNAWTGGACLMGSGGGNTQIIFCNTATPQVRQFNGASGNLNSNATLGTSRVGEALFTNSASDYLKIGNSATVPFATGNNSAPSWAVFSAGGGGFCNCSYADILITVGAPTNSELARLANVYAAPRYGSGALG